MKGSLGTPVAFLAWDCAELSIMDEAVIFGKKAQALEIYESDPELFR